MKIFYNEKEQINIDLGYRLLKFLFAIALYNIWEYRIYQITYI